MVSRPLSGQEMLDFSGVFLAGRQIELLYSSPSAFEGLECGKMSELLGK